ncbi:MAG: hypothetical protein LBR77_11465, partial [Lachnospiraceae bacterium]|nr:hypothetical protein [Lachnospiraceae bacterium]
MLSRKHIALLAAALLLAGCANQPGATNAGQTSPGGTTQAAQAQASADTTAQATQAAQTTQEALTPTTETTQAHTTEAEAGGSETDETKAAGDQGAQPQPGETQPTDTKADAPASGDGQKTSEEQAANTQGGATIQTGDANFDPFFPTGASEEEAKLIKDEYDGLTFTASVNTRQAILPGSVFQVHLTVKNTGDQTVSYVKGSGSFTTPSALSVEVDGLQRVLPQDQLGVNTMDYVTL